MSLRVIEIITPRSDNDEVVKSFEEHRSAEGYVYWSSPMEDSELISFRMILDVQETENVMDRLEHFFAWTDKYRIIVYPAEATIPRLVKLSEDENNELPPPAQENEKKERISREELYTDVLDTALLSKNYIILVLLSSLVAIIGLLRDNVAIIIGAMVIAPLLGPNVGLSLATTLGDKRLSLESLKTLGVGVSLCFTISAAAGLFMGLPNTTEELVARSVITYSDITLAIVSGAAGIITVTQGVPTSLVGVMVALSLLPPLTACGLFFGAGLISHAAGAGMLFMANVICLNLAGVVTFLLQGIQPLSWGDKEQAKSATLRAAILWTILLAILVTIMYLEGR